MTKSTAKYKAILEMALRDYGGIKTRTAVALEVGETTITYAIRRMNHGSKPSRTMITQLNKWYRLKGNDRPLATKTATQPEQLVDVVIYPPIFRNGKPCIELLYEMKRRRWSVEQMAEHFNMPPQKLLDHAVEMGVCPTRKPPAATDATYIMNWR